jgi:hypothetical protein
VLYVHGGTNREHESGFFEDLIFLVKNGVNLHRK